MLSVDWDPSGPTLTGKVVGTALYAAAAYFVDADGRPAFEAGECTCPVGYNCKHVAAIVIAAVGEGTHRAPRRPPSSPAKADRPAWERSLRALIDAPVAVTGEQLLAIELSLQPVGRGLGLMARLMRPGARGGWVNGSLSWAGLDSWHVRDGDYRSDHLALVGELYALHRAREQRAGYYHGHGYGAAGERMIDLSECGSQRLWDLLDEAARIGLRLIHVQPELGELAPFERGELVVDVGRDGKRSSSVTAALRLDHEAQAGLEPLLFLGANGHGVVCADGGDGADRPDLEQRRLRLVRLARPAPPQLQEMVLDGGRVEIPAGELDRFAVEIFPALCRVATVCSADGSFTPPEISEPSLVLRASYGAGHSLELDWAWNYEVGSHSRREPLGLGADAAGFRDPGAERAILAATELVETGLE
ncbi:MAG: SWIM zinc finger family protein, partial [Solirubrobacterales bacterium]|nr:SWIM zinc finger family protein [Solirubrobacterales bacterium]